MRSFVLILGLLSTLVAAGSQHGQRRRMTHQKRSIARRQANTAYAAALGNSNAIQGSSKNLGPFTAQILANETHALVTLQPAAASSGYMAIGFGKTMANADMVVAWQTNGQWTISPRQAAGHAQPQLVAAQTSAYTIVSSLTSSNSVTFLRTLAPPAGAKAAALARAAAQPIIYAASTTSPSSADPSAPIVQHADSSFGVSSIDLSASFASGTTATTSSATAAASTAAAAAPSTSASSSFTPFLSALGNSQAIQGSVSNVGPFQVQTLANETHLLVTLNSSQPMSKAGYMAWGTGSSMANSDMVITWPNSDGTWTLSARSAAGHAAPQPIAQSSAVTLVQSLCSNDSSSYSMVTFLRPLAPPSGYKSSAVARSSGQPIIWAAGTNPNSNSASSSISQHADGSYGLSSMDLSTSILAASSAAPVAATASAPWTRYDSIIVIHALCGALAWILVAPIAVLIGRLARGFQGWMRLHQLLQTVLTLVLTAACFGLGVGAVNMQGGAHFKNKHTALGLAIFIVLLVQVGLGYFSHAQFDPQRTKRPVWNVAHILLGVTLLVMGYVQVDFGLRIYTRQAPPYVWAAYIILMAGFFAAYVISCGRLIVTRREEGKPLSHAALGLGRDLPSDARSDSRQGLRGDNTMSFFDQPVTEQDAPPHLRHSVIASREWAAQTNDRAGVNRPMQQASPSGIKPLILQPQAVEVLRDSAQRTPPRPRHPNSPQIGIGLGMGTIQRGQSPNAGPTVAARQFQKAPMGNPYAPHRQRFDAFLDGDELRGDSRYAGAAGYSR